MSDKFITQRVIAAAVSDVSTKLGQLSLVLSSAETFDLDVLRAARNAHCQVERSLEALDDVIGRRIDELRRGGESLAEIADVLGVHPNTVRRWWEKSAQEPIELTKRHVKQHQLLLDGIRAWKTVEAAAAQAEGRAAYATPRVEEVVEVNGEEVTVGRRLYVQKRAAAEGRIDPDLAVELAALLGDGWAVARRNGVVPG